jgi:PHD/YefM family antitoxin component YafN of YafNO toxin-antitoxin module
MAVLEVTSRQFRDKQKFFFDLADAGRQIVIRRRRKQAYVLTPVEDDDFVLTPELLEKLEKARQQARDGKSVVCKTYEDSVKFLESL